MLSDVFTWLGNLSGYGISPDLAAAFGFCVLLFALSEFFRLLELLISHITRR